MPRTMYLGELNCGEFCDNAMAVWFRAPNSYTGEDMVEFHTHGGIAVTEGALNSCIRAGARLAHAGEFSKRAFLNGKMSLSEAEGVIGMINAESSAQAGAEYALMSGGLSMTARQMQDSLTDMLASIEAELDYPEEVDSEMSLSALLTQISGLLNRTQGLLATRRTGQYITDGIKVAIAGRANAGKSSLLNRLLDFERAIVTDIAGTTRDTISESYIYKGVKFLITDTAGIRDTDSDIERLGIQRSYMSIKAADIVLHVFEDDDSASDEEISRQSDGKPLLRVRNKSDLIRNAASDTADIMVSALTGEGIDGLKERIYSTFIDSGLVGGGILLTNARHYSALTDTAQALTSALLPDSVELIAFDLKSAWDSLGEITGETVSELIIDRIFAKFCLGK